MDETGGIISIGQNVSKIEDIAGQYIGLLKFSGNGLRTLKILLDSYDISSETEQTFRRMYMTDLLQGLINSGISIQPHWIDGKWLEVDSVSDLKVAEKIMQHSCEDTRVEMLIERPARA